MALRLVTFNRADQWVRVQFPDGESLTMTGVEDWRFDYLERGELPPEERPEPYGVGGDGGKFTT